MESRNSLFVQLKARCAELEQAAGPQHSAKVRGLLEKERGLQQKISQIASTKGQLLQQGTDSQVRFRGDRDACDSIEVYRLTLPTLRLYIIVRRRRKQRPLQISRRHLLTCARHIQRSCSRSANKKLRQLL